MSRKRRIAQFRKDALDAERSDSSEVTEDQEAPEGEGRPEGAHESFEAWVPSPPEIEKVWLTRSLPSISDEVEDGEGKRRRRFSMEKLKAEMFDFAFLIDNAALVYRHITGGVTDNLQASAAGIIAMADRRVAELTFGLREDLERERGRRRDAELRVRQLENALELAKRGGEEDGEPGGSVGAPGRPEV